MRCASCIDSPSPQMGSVCVCVCGCAMNLVRAVPYSSHQTGWHLKMRVILVSGLGPGGQTPPVRPGNTPEGQETPALGVGGFSGPSGVKRTAL